MDKSTKKHPDYTRGGLKNLNKAVYAWLSIYERAWLKEHLPPKDLGKNSKKRSIDSYHHQDLMFTEEAKRVVNDWAKYEKIRGKLIRKTYASVTKILGIHKRCLIKERHPVLKEYITTIEESLQDFQKRRIRYVLDTKFKGKAVSVSTLITATSISKYVRNEEGDIKGYLYKMMEAHNQKYL